MLLTLNVNVNLFLCLIKVLRHEGIWSGGRVEVRDLAIGQHTCGPKCPEILFFYIGKCEVKCTLLLALRLCTGRTAHRGIRSRALLFLYHGTRRGEGSASRPGRSLPPRKTRYPLYRRLGGPQARSGQVRKISPPNGIRSPDRPARSQCLYRLSYPVHLVYVATLLILKRHQYIPIVRARRVLFH